MRTSARPLHLLTAVLACLSCSRDAAAHPRGPQAPYVVTVEDDEGRELRTFHHDGQTFVLGEYGGRYTIRVQNHTGRRVEAVVSVDGRDVISGRVGDFVHERGYLVDAYGDAVIEGFRQSTQDVAAFRFTDPGDSYSTKMGTPQNVGVIGVAVFPERVYPIPLRTRPQHMPRRYEYDDSYGRRSEDRSPAEAKRKSGNGLGSSGPSPASAPASRSYEGGLADAAETESSSARQRSAGSSYAPAPSAPKDNLGTAYGESLSSAVEERPFERAQPSSPASVIALRYDDRAGLLARGIQLEPVYRAYRPPVPCGPNAFPGNRFAPPPCRD